MEKAMDDGVAKRERNVGNEGVLDASQMFGCEKYCTENHAVVVSCSFFLSYVLFFMYICISNADYVHAKNNE